MLVTNGFLNVVALGTVHKGQLKITVVVFKPVYNIAVLLVFRAYIKKAEVFFMLVHYIKQAFIRSVCAVKNFSFPVKDKFLQVKGNRFRYTEILCVLRNRNLIFFAGAKKMINRITACKNNAGEAGYIDFLLPEVFSG